MTEGGPTRLGASEKCCAFTGAAADLPGLRPFRRGLGLWRRHIVRSVDLKQTVCSDGRKIVVRSVDLKQNVCIFSASLILSVFNWESIADPVGS